MCGNSLIDEFEGIKLFDEGVFNTCEKSNSKDVVGGWQTTMFIDQMDTITNRLFAEQEKFFAENDTARKEEIKANINHTIDAIIRAKLSRDNNETGLARYEASLKEKTKPYFLWKLEFARVFKEKGGFDVVIGNPPYVGESGHKEIFRPIANTEFGKRFYYGKMDLFYFFFHKGIDIGNKNAEITFITTNYYPTAFGAKKMREDFYRRTQIRKIINFNELKVFESALGQHYMITSITKQRQKNIIVSTCMCNQVGVASSNLLNEILHSQDKQSTYLQLTQEQIFEGDEFYIRLAGINVGNKNSIGSILDKMASQPIKLGNVTDINQGVVTGCDTVSGRNIAKSTNSDIINNDGIFVFDLKNTRDLNIVQGMHEGRKLLRDFYKNSDIRKYWCSEVATKKLLYFQGEANQNKYPDVVHHLSKFKEILEARLVTYNERYHWTAIHRPREEKIFTRPKILAPYRSKTNSFAYTEAEWFCRSDAYVITLKNNDFDLKYILGLLNSKLYFAWLYHRGKRKGEIMELFQVPLCEIPIIEADKIVQRRISNIVDRILTAKQVDPISDTSNLEGDIDKMVYELYGLTDEEIKIVEGV